MIMKKTNGANSARKETISQSKRIEKHNTQSAALSSNNRSKSPTTQNKIIIRSKRPTYF